MTSMKTVSAWTTDSDAAAAANALSQQIGEASPSAVLFFATPDHDGEALSAALRERFDCPVIGCTTAGELSDHAVNERGVTAIAFGPDKVVRAAATAIEFGDDVGGEVRAGVQRLARELNIDVRQVDSRRYVGIVLIDGLSQHEEEVNHALGTAAPGLLFVGGSAGDDLRFVNTRVFLDGKSSSRGAVLLLMEVRVPVAVTKSYSAEPTEHRFRVTKANAAKRIVYEVDHKPVLPVYASIAGVDPEKLDAAVFMRYPWALLDGQDAWLRSAKGTTPDGGLEFLCSIREGAHVTVMRQTSIIETTEKAFADAAKKCGGEIGAAVIFNCVYRRIELDESDLHQDYAKLYKDFPSAGFHTYGESLIAHINQTCTALFLG